MVSIIQFKKERDRIIFCSSKVVIFLFFIIFSILNGCRVNKQSVTFTNPLVKNGVATFIADINIGTKFLVPDEWDKVIIKANVTVTGSFYMPERTKPIEFAGESRATSIIKGDGTRPTDDGKKGRTYSAIRCDKSPDLYVHDLRSLNPMKFHIHGGFGKVTVERCDIIEDRGTHTTDGVHGGIGLVTVKDCYINTWDDAVYVSECKLVENTTIVHNKNGVPFQVTWGHRINGEKCIIRNCTVIDKMGANETGTYNQGVVSWASKQNENSTDKMMIKFEGGFTHQIAEGKIKSHMYQLGRKSKGISNCTIEVEGYCDEKESIVVYDNTNSRVVFKGCN